MSIFEDVREIPFEDVVRMCGIDVARNKTCRCPFHNDGHPSMKIYQDHGYCFACGTASDGVKLTAQVFGVSQIDGARKIAGYFGIAETPFNPNAINQLKLLREQERLEKLAADNAFNVGATLLHLLSNWSKQYAPRLMSEEPDKRFVFALQYRDYLEYLLDSALDEGKNFTKWAKDSGFINTIESLSYKAAKIGGENNG